jgi:hypothetical protein
MKLVNDWRKSWRWFSMQAQAAGVALQGSWLLVPEDVKTQIPGTIVTGIAMFLLIAGMLGRLVVQDEQRA